MVLFLRNNTFYFPLLFYYMDIIMKHIILLILLFLLGLYSLFFVSFAIAILVFNILYVYLLYIDKCNHCTDICKIEIIIANDNVLTCNHFVGTYLNDTEWVHKANPNIAKLKKESDYTPNKYCIYCGLKL